MKINNNGFTLVELLAVIVIIALIGSITYKIISDVIPSTNIKVHEANLKLYAKAVADAKSKYLIETGIDITETSPIISQKWLDENVKVDNIDVICNQVEYQQEVKLYGCYFDGDLADAYSYTNNKIEKVELQTIGAVLYGNSIQNGTPSPTSPVEVQSVGDKTKNLLDIDKCLNSYLTTNGNGEYTITKKDAGRFSTYININLEAGTTYTFSYELIDTNSTYYFPLQFNIRFEDGTSQTRGFSTTGNVFQYTPSKNVSTMAIYQEGSMPVGTYATFKNLQIEEGATATEYGPYGKYKIPITVTNQTETKTTNIYLDEPLRKIGNYADSLDLTTGKVVRKNGKYVFTGNEEWKYFKSTGVNQFYFDINNVLHPVPNGMDSNIMSDNYTGINIDNRKNNYDSIYTHTSGIAINDNRNYSSTSTTTSGVADFKAWLKEQYSNGTPVTVYYVMKSPVVENINVPSLPVLEGNVNYLIGTKVQPTAIEYKRDVK